MRGRKLVINVPCYVLLTTLIKKESPNEGTETGYQCTVLRFADYTDKKRIPE